MLVLVITFMNPFIPVFIIWLAPVAWALAPAAVPRHIAFVCDGNQRWAKARHLPSSAGHMAGAERVVEVLSSLKANTGIQYCTMYAFSTENWQRSPSEVSAVLDVMETFARRFYRQLLQEKVRFRVLGDIEDARIPESLRDVLQRLERDTSTADDSNLTLSIAVNYGARQDILQATRRIAALVAGGKLDVKDVDETLFASCLSTAGLPDPDLIVRTSGECRLSNFLLFDAAYSELYFTDTLWPDFDAECLSSALDWFAGRRRRFGARAEVAQTGRP